MKISPVGLSLIRRFEGCRLEAYQCEAGVWTIGYGHTGAHVVQGATCTQHQAEVMLESDVERFELAVSALVPHTVTQWQFDALVSFAFNLGAAALARSKLLRLLRAGDVPGAAAQFGFWVFAGGKPSPGLVKRRAAERDLFLSHPQGVVP